MSCMVAKGARMFVLVPYRNGCANFGVVVITLAKQPASAPGTVLATATDHDVYCSYAGLSSVECAEILAHFDPYKELFVALPQIWWPRPGAGLRGHGNFSISSKCGSRMTVCLEQGLVHWVCSCTKFPVEKTTPYSFSKWQEELFTQSARKLCDCWLSGWF